MDADITFRIAGSREYPRIAEMYAGWGYRGDVSPEDVLYVAERGTQLVAAVRRTQEHELLLLRGLYVAPALQRRGIGSRLLDAFVNDLKDMACYCVPYAHLRGFYGRVGFAPLADNVAPNVLRDRLTSYRARGLDVLVMLRALPSSVFLPKGPNQSMQPTADRSDA